MSKPELVELSLLPVVSVIACLWITFWGMLSIIYWNRIFLFAVATCCFRFIVVNMLVWCVCKLVVWPFNCGFITNSNWCFIQVFPHHGDSSCGKCRKHMEPTLWSCSESLSICQTSLPGVWQGNVRNYKLKRLNVPITIITIAVCVHC